jgi:2-dehydropantoate 2-reductase
VLAVKAHSSSGRPRTLKLLGPKTMVMTIQNGMPVVFSEACRPADGTRLKTLDLRGMLAVHSTSTASSAARCLSPPRSEPGVIRHIGSNRFPIGEIDGRLSDRVRAVESSFVKAGLQASAVSNIRAEIWWKALGNLAVNPISALTNTTMIEILRFPETRALVLETMQEAREIAAKLGISFNQTLEQRLESAESVGAHKILDVAGSGERAPLEIEALTGAVLRWRGSPIRRRHASRPCMG